jgi:hypothetical protein
VRSTSMTFSPIMLAFGRCTDLLFYCMDNNRTPNIRIGFVVANSTYRLSLE